MSGQYAAYNATSPKPIPVGGTWAIVIENPGATYQTFTVPVDPSATASTLSTTITGNIVGHCPGYTGNNWGYVTSSYNGNTINRQSLTIGAAVHYERWISVGIFMNPNNVDAFIYAYPGYFDAILKDGYITVSNFRIENACYHQYLDHNLWIDITDIVFNGTITLRGVLS